MASHQHPRSGKRLVTILGIISVLAVVGWLVFGKDAAPQTGPRQNITIALPTQLSGGAVYIGVDQHIFEQHGLNLTVQPFTLGRQALQSVLQGKADLAILADVPFMFAVVNGEKIATVATIFGSRRTMAVVARKDRGITRAEDLSGKIIGTTFGTNAQFFVDTLLVAHSVPRTAVTVVDLKPNTLVDALVKGEVDAVTVWHPDLAKLEHAMGNGAVTIRGEDIFVYRFMLVGKQDYLDTHQKEVKQVLTALEEATRFIHQYPPQSQAIIGKALGMDAALLSEAFDPGDFYLTLDQTLLLSLSDETRWAMKQGLVQVGPVPNYLRYLRQEPLESISPSAVKIIH